jgi:putative toxin-antitoxin system antitoxin component (TIGR02293 family)
MCHIAIMIDKVAHGKPAARRAASLARAGLEERWLEATSEAARGTGKPLAIRDFKAIWGPRFRTEELEELVVPRRTLARRKVQSGKLSQEETDRALRLARVASDADRVFGNEEKASRWLRKPHTRLGGRAPLALLASEAGTAVVEEMLGQIEHGMFA